MMKAVVFDYNGVLVDDLKVHEEAYIELAKRHNSKLTPEDIKRIMSKSPGEKAELIMNIKNKNIIKKLLKEKENIYIEMSDNTRLFPSVIDVITSLSEKYKLAIITHTTRKQLDAIFPSELVKKFEIILDFNDLEKPKPAPNSLLLVMEKLDVKNTESCYIGDTPFDMKAAKNANVLAIGITTGFSNKEELEEAGADIVIGSLSELEGALQNR